MLAKKYTLNIYLIFNNLQYIFDINNNQKFY